MMQIFHAFPVLNAVVLAPGAAWDVFAGQVPASATEEITNDFVWLLIGN